MPAKPKYPNWPVWLNVPKWAAWEAVALSLNIEPRETLTNRDAWMGGSSDFPHDEGPDFDDRLEVLRRNMSTFELVTINMGRPDYCEIRPGEFVAFAKKLGWTLPPELADVSQPPAAAKPAADPPDLSTLERNSLLKLVIGMAIHGYGFDPNAGKGSAPPEIAADLEKLGIGLDADTVRKYLREGAALLPGKPDQKSGKR